MRNLKAFTLVELLVVVLIIGILAAVALPQYRVAVDKAHMAEAFAQVKALVVAEKSYYLANGEYADDLTKLDIDRSDTPNWYFMFGHTKKNEPYIYGGRRSAGHTDKNMRVYLRYYLLTDFFACAAHQDDIVATKICKTFNAQGSKCPNEKYSYFCYPINS